MWTMCKFHGSNGNGLGDIWWTDKFFYYNGIIDVSAFLCMLSYLLHGPLSQN